MNIAAKTPDRTPRRNPIAEHARVRLRKALPEHHLHAGATGTVVHLYRRGGLEVEFATGGKSSTVVTLDAESIELLVD